LQRLAGRVGDAGEIAVKCEAQCLKLY
jgi:hypothetical protein